jgi:UDP:flavonoid glycosyltransferase YjiC (YdhE family)
LGSVELLVVGDSYWVEHTLKGVNMKKILFISEAVTWSQVVRLAVLARALDPRRYDVHFAAARFDERVFHDTNFTRWPITSVNPERVVESANSTQGWQLWTKEVLQKYVDEEMHLYEAIDPDLVVHDARWSVPISAPAFGVPCATLVNAYWSRRTTRKYFPMPDHPLARHPDRPFSVKYVLPAILSVTLRVCARPMNKLRRAYGLPKLGDMVDVMMWGDRVLFSDDPLITPLKELAPHETFLGPILWSPQVPLPDYWDELGRDRPMIYATPGSSGMAKTALLLLEALGDVDADVVFSAAGRDRPNHVAQNIRVVDMIPGDLAARKAAVVVCNGGASTGYQALAEGTPVISIPSNIDQMLAATAMKDAGTGIIVRQSLATPEELRAAVERVMHDERFTQAAQRVAASFARFDPHARFRIVIDEVTTPAGA